MMGKQYFVTCNIFWEPGSDHRVLLWGSKVTSSWAGLPMTHHQLCLCWAKLCHEILKGKMLIWLSELSFWMGEPKCVISLTCLSNFPSYIPQLSQLAEVSGVYSMHIYGVTALYLSLQIKKPNLRFCHKTTLTCCGRQREREREHRCYWRDR